ncbi:right-handed parallel beta-helix repeat-containing protein [Chitinophaga vietnamensis]|uniref:right-handed parallel beta-helix repeat-containing protein n=1 Tax=Chitinophaga vietnamensis TaxID=2593957 RepID=UPI0011775A24|nr:right-handed parallel beta-helix repeat-containing protein [Chitinophaga vietnamensis]
MQQPIFAARTSFRAMALAALAAVSLLAACSKSNSVITNQPAILPANAITATTLAGGAVKGVMLSDSTYTINGNITVLASDTLTIQPGVTIRVTKNSAFYVQGMIISEGTKDKPITFTTPTQQAGDWGGIQADSAKYVSFKWTKLLWTGGPDSSGNPRKTLFVAAPIQVNVWDCWIQGGQDDGVRCQNGAKISILRNTIDAQGTTDGEAINIKTGATGDIAYNVIWGGAGSAIKIETSTTVQIPTTYVRVYNNTCVDNGFRRGAAEPGRGILCDAFGSGEFFNNLIVNNYQGLDIAPDADTAKVTYGNNFFYATVDTLRAGFYPVGSVGKPQSGDIISTGSNNNNPMFITYTSNPPNPSLRNNPNNFHLQSGSPAIGKGKASYNNDIGAFTSDGKGNQH